MLRASCKFVSTFDSSTSLFVKFRRSCSRLKSQSFKDELYEEKQMEWQVNLVRHDLLDVL
jgi:hypothetical protein